MLCRRMSRHGIRSRSLADVRHCQSEIDGAARKIGRKTPPTVPRRFSLSQRIADLMYGLMEKLNITGTGRGQKGNPDFVGPLRWAKGFDRNAVAVEHGARQHP